MASEEKLETVTAARRVLVSYDVKSRRRTEACLVQQYLFGREVTVRTKSGPKRYRYEGLIHKPGVERVGQSVFLLQEEEAEALTGFLRKHHVSYYREEIWVRA